MDVKNYEDAGFIYRAGLDWSSPWAQMPGKDDIRSVVKCTRCGALVNAGGLSRERHDQFHTALADLFDKLTADQPDDEAEIHYYSNPDLYQE